MNTITQRLLHGIMILVQITCALIMLAVSLFCVFGFLASMSLVMDGGGRQATECLVLAA